MRNLFVILVLLVFVCSCERQSHNTSTNNIGRSSSQYRTHNDQSPSRRHTFETETLSGTSSKVRMKKERGVYIVPIKINGLELDFIFDSGAADIVISSAEAIVLLKQGKLKEEDIIGEAYYEVADGTIAAGTVINLRTVQIANKVLHNVRATVVDNLESPLLLGQSALSRFGEISIDYNNLTIEFK